MTELGYKVGLGILIGSIGISMIGMILTLCHHELIGMALSVFAVVGVLIGLYVGWFE